MALFKKFEFSDDRITNPQTYIHHYATQTPASIVIVDGGSSGNVAAPLGTTPTITTTRITTSSRVETESSSPASNYTGKVPVRRVNQRASDLVKDLRDSGEFGLVRAWKLRSKW